MRHLPSILLLSASTIVGGCGAAGAVGNAVGSAIGNGIVNAFTGFPVHSVEGYVTDGGVVVQGDVLRVGDSDLGTRFRSTFGFDLPASSFNKATLRLHIDNVIGQPFMKLGGLFLQRVDLGATLDAGDYGPGHLGSVEILSSATTGLVEIDITAMAQAAQLGGDAEIHFRLRMALAGGGDALTDQIVLSSHDAGVDTTRPSIFFVFD